jgi:hypothetical protein
MQSNDDRHSQHNAAKQNAVSHMLNTIDSFRNQAPRQTQRFQSIGIASNP